MDIYTSYLDHVSQQVPESQSLADIINLVTSDEFKESVQKIRSADDDITGKKLKVDLLPLFFPTVQIFNQNSLDEDSIPTGIIQFDIDVQDNPELDFDKLKETACAIPEVIYAFESPRGGVKFGIQTDFKKNDDDDLYSLKKRYTQAYYRSFEYVQQFVTIEDDDHMKNLKYACFLSWDQDAYYNPDCKTLAVNDQCIYEPPQIIATSEQDVSTEQVEELLQFIPRDFEWGERRSINYAVFSCIGRSGIPILFNHWTTSDQGKLALDLESQYRSMDFGSFGHLVNVAKQNGYKPTTGRARQRLLPKDTEFKFPPLVSHEEGMKQLDQHLQGFLDTGKNAFINVSTGAGKSEAVIQFLQDLPKRNNQKRYSRKRVLLLVPSHDLAEDIKGRLGKRVNHIQGKKAVCERKVENLDPYYKAKVNPPIEQCTKGCHLFDTCPYIRQFDDLLTNIRIMTHSELVNMPSAWLYGSKNGQPRSGGWKPDYIIVDEDWLIKEEYEETYSDTDYKSIRNVIHACDNGASLPDAIQSNIVQLTKDYAAMESGQSQRPEFKNQMQFILDSQTTLGKSKSVILEYLTDYATTENEDYIRSVRFQNNSLRASVIKAIAERYKDTPTLFLDATADEMVVKQLLDVDFHSVTIKPNDGISLYQLQGRTMLKKDFADAAFRNQIVDGLKALSAKYQNVGLISYKSVDDFPGNFSEWLAKKCGIQIYGHFGNIRGMDQFKDVNCLLVVGRYLIPDNELENYSYGIFGEASRDKEYADVLARMKDGNAMALNNLPFVSASMRRVKKHFSDSETIQAIGRARLIHGSPKDIYLFSHESLGADIEITSFFELGDLIDSPEVSKLKEIGFCQDKPKTLIDLGYAKSQVKEKREQIDTELRKAGIKKVEMKIKDSNRNTRPHVYYVHDMAKLEYYIAEGGGVIKDVSFE